MKVRRESLNSTILLNDQTILNESYLKSTDAIMSSQLSSKGFHVTVLSCHVESLTSQMQSVLSIQGNGNAIRY